MSARNMVRNLRDNGDLDGRQPARVRGRQVLYVILALAFGVVACLGAIYAGPTLIKMVEKKPPPVHYAKPGLGS